MNTPHVAAFGSFTKRYLFEGGYKKSSNEVIVKNIWEYFDDGFNFEDSEKGFISQALGAWNYSIFNTSVEVGKMPSVNKFYLFNSTFSNFREKTGIGKDFKIKGKRQHKNKFINTIKFTNNEIEYK